MVFPLKSQCKHTIVGKPTWFSHLSVKTDLVFPLKWEKPTWFSHLSGKTHTPNNNTSCRRCPSRTDPCRSRGTGWGSSRTVVQYDESLCSLVELCKWSFDAGVRGAGGTGGENPTIVDMARVECPAELVQLTQIKANNIDCPVSYTHLTLPTILRV